MMALIFAGVFFSILAGVSILIAVGIYNGLVSLKKQVERSWANIDVILKQRHDEVPQLIKIVEQFTGHEAVILRKVSEARAHYVSAGADMSEKIKASNEMTLALRGVLAIGEAYPDLKSSQHYLQLQNRLSALEEQLANRREHFNDSVATYNTRIAQFPDIFFAQALGYYPLEHFQVSEHEKLMPSLEVKAAA
jgi:LemA protein